MNTSSDMPNFLGRRRLLAGFGATAALGACANAAEQTPPNRPPLGSDPLARFRLFADAGQQKWEDHLAEPAAGRKLRVLALSSGGEEGAFGAGALVGWSATGTRPEFDIVTGISIGALIAPFAFIGSSVDDKLEGIFTDFGTEDIVKFSPFHSLFRQALYDTTKLDQLITRSTPNEFIDLVAQRHAAGARLFIVTSELETARASVWDMGEIAQAGEYTLFRAIMRASAALPGLFAPVDLKFTANGETYTETHVDGGVHMQFLAVPAFAFRQRTRDLPDGEIYLLINNTLDPAPVAVARNPLAISQQALTTFARASALSSMNATSLFARENGLDLYVTSIDPKSGIVFDPSNRFSLPYMTELFEYGLERGKNGTLWVRG
ncbi:Patatin-like phospholipase [Sulfitobacter marinus]|uniref:Patatin-like phospholipase n=1 Tax=Sulfitobacter marinus TaxID=394264 RepID=A0A1I6RXM3_9RHOB|nr:patatin-like phospholipase family protein [Sulfitobacter marinus]SFS69340.1 Patatin-like phospholipase [Sulfitobacter marinus]